MEKESKLDSRCADYHAKVQLQAEALIRTAKKGLYAKFRAEHKDVQTRISWTNFQTREIIKGIGGAAREYGQNIKEEKEREMNSIEMQLKRKYRHELRNMKQPTEEKTIQDILENAPEKEGTIDSGYGRIVVCSSVPACEACCNASTKLSLCGACGVVWYCNELCQKKDWEKHQQICPGCTSENEEEHA